MVKIYWKKCQRTSLLLGGIAIASALASSPSLADTLPEALAAAYTNNPSLEAERANLRATDEQVPQALAGWRPSVTGDGTFGTQITDTTPKVSTSRLGRRQTVDPLRAQVSVSQSIFSGGQTLYGTRRARASVRAGRESLRNAEQTTLLNAVTAYMNVLRDEAVVKLRQKNVQVLTRQLEAAGDRFDVGEITRTDIAQSKARLGFSQTNLISAEAQLTTSRTNYARVIGNAPGTLQPPPPLPGLPQNERQALELARAQNPILLAARYAERAAQYAISGAKGGLLPSLSVDASYQYAEDPSGTTSKQDIQTLTGRVRIPLYQGGAQYSRIREARQRHVQNRMIVSDTLRQIDEGVQTSWEQLRSTKAAIASNAQQVAANEIALEGVRQEQQVGSRTTLDVLDAEQELLNSRVTLVRAERDAYVAGYRLLALIGGLSARQLELAVDYYDPTENFEDVEDRWIGFGILDRD